MAIWLSVLKWVPWGEVIANAPKVADAARKLWNTASAKPGADVATPTRPSGSSNPSALQARLDSAEEQIARLHEQMQASTELIKALADQNTQLIKRIESNRVRVLWLAAATLFSLTLAVSLVLRFT